MNAAVWYYAQNNEQKGPVSEQELGQMLGSRQLPAETLIWAPSLANWTPANQVDPFKAIFAAPQPPAPPPLPAASAAPHAVAGSGQSSMAGFETQPAQYQFEQAGQSQPAASGSKWGDLDSIPTPGSGRSPNGGGNSGSQFSSADLDAIGRKPQPAPSNGGASQFNSAELDAIGRPGGGSGGSGASQFNPSELDAIGRKSQPAASSAGASQFNPAELDAIGRGSQPAASSAGSSQFNAAELDAIGRNPSPQPAPSSASASRFNSAELDAIGRNPSPQAAPSSDSAQRFNAAELDAIGRNPSPQAAPSNDSASRFNSAELDAIGRQPAPSSSGQAAAAPASYDPSELESIGRHGGLSDSGRIRKASQGAGHPSTEFAKGHASHISRQSFTNLPALKSGGPGINLNLNLGTSEPVSSDDLTTPRPWKRYFARLIDDTLYATPAGLLMIFLGTAPPWNFIIAFIGLVIKLALEVVVLSKFGTSVGKRCFNIHVKDEATGQPISREMAIQRTIWLTLFAGWLLPFISWAFCAWQYVQLTGTGKSSWDAKVGVRYEHHPPDELSGKMLIGAIAYCVIWGFIFTTLIVMQTWTKIAQQVGGH